MSQKKKKNKWRIEDRDVIWSTEDVIQLKKKEAENEAAKKIRADDKTAFYGIYGNVRGVKTRHIPKSDIKEINRVPFLIWGYVVGVIIALIFYWEQPQYAEIDLTNSWGFILILSLLILLLIFSRMIRCVTALAMIAGCGPKGRGMNMLFAHALLASGAILNIIRNIGEMAFTLTCSQTQLKRSIVQMTDMVQEPVNSVQLAVYTIISDMHNTMEQLDNILLNLEKKAVILLASYESCDEWLIQQRDNYDRKMGTPYERCLRTSSLSIDLCRTRFLSHTLPQCSIRQRFEWFCSQLKGIRSYFNQAFDNQNNIWISLLKRVETGFSNIREIFKVSITFDRSKKPNFSSAINMTLMSDEINAKLEARGHNVSVFMTLMAILCLFNLLIIFYTAIDFRYRYLKSLHYCNFYLTKYFYILEDQQHHFQHITALPLSGTDFHVFTKLRTFRLLPHEFDKMVTNLCTLFLGCIRLFCICFVDHCLYVMLTTLGHRSEIPDKEVETNNVPIFNLLLKNLFHAFDPVTQLYAMKMEECLPSAVQPNYLRYKIIIVLCVLDGLMCLFGPYGLRLRHVVMCFFYPWESLERAIKLHRLVVLYRGQRMKCAVRKARSEFLLSPDEEIWILGILKKLYIRIFGPFAWTFCTVCGKHLSKAHHVRCPTDGCPGVYCSSCHLFCNRTCCLCNSPEEYGDRSDISEIVDSSFDSEEVSFHQQRARCAGPEILTAVDDDDED